MDEQLPLDGAVEDVDVEPLPVPAPIAERPAAFADGMALLPVEEQNRVLAEYDERRKSFREWLLSHLKPGIHYGVPPGCEPRTKPKPEQWQHKPSLYKAGALLLVDLLKLRPAFEADNDAWAQLGRPDATFVMKCRLILPSTDRVVGEGRGVFAVGEKKGMNANSAIKMAEKRALVDAIINTVAVCGDLFTQDEPDKDTHDARRTDVDHEEAQPTPPPSGTSYITKQWNQLKRDYVEARYGAERPESAKIGTDLESWVGSILGRDVPDPKTLDGKDLATLTRWLEANGCKHREEVE